MLHTRIVLSNANHRADNAHSPQIHLLHAGPGQLARPAFFASLTRAYPGLSRIPVAPHYIAKAQPRVSCTEHRRIPNAQPSAGAPLSSGFRFAASGHHARTTAPHLAKSSQPAASATGAAVSRRLVEHRVVAATRPSGLQRGSICATPVESLCGDADPAQPSKRIPHASTCKLHVLCQPSESDRLQELRSAIAVPSGVRLDLSTQRPSPRA